MVSRLRGVRVPHFVPLFIFLLLAWATFFEYGNVYFAFPISCWAIPLECWLCLIYFSALCSCIMHDICIYIFLHVCGWLCTFYDGLLWLHEWPSLVMKALDVVVWVCAQGNCRRCIFMLYYVHDHCGMIALIHVTKWHWFPMYAVLINMLDALKGFGSLRYEHVNTRHIHEHEILPMRHSTSNVKLCWIFTVKIGHPHCCILTWKTW